MAHDPDTRLSLIARMCDRSDNDAWSEFVQIYQPVIQRFLQKYGLQYADAVEVTQEVLGGVVKSIDLWDSSRKNSTFRGWLYQITRNKAVNFVKEASRKRQLEFDSKFEINQVADRNRGQPDADFHMEFERQLFSWAAEKLMPTFKPTNWQAFWMSTVEGSAIEQVAAKLQIDESTVYVARCRIMKRMAALIETRLGDSLEPENKETRQ